MPDREHNVVLLGAMSHLVAISEKSWQAALVKRFPKKLLDLNQRAFAEGKRLAAEAASQSSAR